MRLRIIVAQALLIFITAGCSPDASTYQSLTPDEARRLATSGRPLHFTRLTSLSPNAAKALVQWRNPDTKYGGLFFKAGLELSSDAASELAKYPDSLWLDLRSLPIDVAAALQPHQGSLLVEVPPDSTVELPLAAVLVKHKGALRFIGLRHISTELAEILASCPGTLGLQEVSDIGSQAAQYLKRHPEVWFDRAKNPNMEGYKSRKQLEQEQADRASLLRTVRENADRGFLVEYGPNSRDVVVGPPFHRLPLTQKESLLGQVADLVSPNKSLTCTITVYDSKYDSVSGLRKGEKLGEFIRDSGRVDAGFKRIGER